MKALIVIILVVGALIGGLLTLRNSAATGMPDQAVLERAKQRAREQAEAEKAADKDG